MQVVFIFTTNVKVQNEVGHTGMLYSRSSEAMHFTNRLKFHL